MFLDTPPHLKDDDIEKGLEEDEEDVLDEDLDHPDELEPAKKRVKTIDFCAAERTKGLGFFANHIL